MAKLTFLGTKGEIAEETERHRFHSSLLVESGGTKLLIDYGLLHHNSLDEIAPNAVLITHAHPDHYSWLKQDVESGITIYLTQETMDYGKFKPQNGQVIAPMEKFKVGPITCLAYRVIHSVHCPAVGWKLVFEGKTLAYNSDLVDIEEKVAVLAGVDLYIGDGSSVNTNLVRRRRNVLVGHTRIITQIHWCEKFGIKNIIFTHLGSETLREEENLTENHPEMVMAYDGLEIEV
jgi:ribonuclease BN (tRNA processing enzyme)